MFPLIAFTADKVANITGLSIHQLHRWHRVGFFAPSIRNGERIQADDSLTSRRMNREAMGQGAIRKAPRERRGS
jgi:DNA-binding transcriptional MerR regulator